MKVALIGATGMTGSELLTELLGRGHEVTAISRSAQSLQPRTGLTARSADIMDIGQLQAAVAGHAAIISAYSPGHASDMSEYRGPVEAAWRLKRVVADQPGTYLIFVGGASSLYVAPGVQHLEDPRWPKWYFDTASVEHLRYLVSLGLDFLAPVADARESGVAMSPETETTYNNVVQFIAGHPYLLEGCRAAFEIFRNDSTIDWSFVSPPWFYRPGPRTGQYRIAIDNMPMDNGVPAGVSVSDLAVAIADEMEARKLVHTHWCPHSAGA